MRALIGGKMLKVRPIVASLLALTGVNAAHADGGSLRLGLLAELSGPFAPSGTGERNGLQIYLSRHGGMLGGLKVEVVTEDTAGDPATAITKVRKLVESDNIDILIGPTSSATGAAIKDYVNEHHVLTLIESTVDEVVQGKYMFRTTFAGDAEGYLEGYLPAKAGYRQAVLIAPNYIAGQEAVDYFEKGFVAGGGKIVQKLMPRLGAPDFGSFIGQISPQADVAIVFMPGTDGLRFIKQYADYGKPLPMYGFTVTVDEQQLSAEGKAAEGFIGASFYFSTIDTPENKELMKEWGNGYQGQEKPSWQTLGGIIAAQVLDSAIGRLKGNIMDKEKLLKAVADTRMTTPSGSFRFDDRHNPIMPRYIMQIREIDGVVQPVILSVLPEFIPRFDPPNLPSSAVLK
jgi:branched-chain amino acid transport system substrate-binding protein